MTDSVQKKGGYGRKTLLGLAIAAAIASTLGFLYKTDKGEEVRGDIEKKAKDISKRFKKTRQQVEERVKDFYGELTDDFQKNYLELQGEILAELENSKEENKSVTKTQYNKLVDEIVDEFGQGKKWTKEQIQKLTKALDEDWEDLKDEFSNNNK